MLLIFLYFVLLALILFVNVWAHAGYSKTCKSMTRNELTSLKSKMLPSFHILNQYVE